MSTVDGRVNEVVILHLVLGSLDSTFDHALCLSVKEVKE